MAIQTASILASTNPKQSLESILNIYTELVTYFNSRPADIPDDATTISIRHSLATVEQLLGMQTGLTTTGIQPEAADFTFTVPDPRHTAQASLDARYPVDYHTAYSGAQFTSAGYEPEAYCNDSFGRENVPNESNSFGNSSEILQTQINRDYMYGQSSSAYGYNSSASQKADALQENTFLMPEMRSCRTPCLPPVIRGRIKDATIKKEQLSWKVAKAKVPIAVDETVKDDNKTDSDAEWASKDEVAAPGKPTPTKKVILVLPKKFRKKTSHLH
ncbi:hypothetical protein BJ508DRAFT_347308 [Ascobolus immersus RN42]|uniref:Uncharacterized protein n=1 Tax=Ascobolus immersus RN42 TaxID=1160509 RepID=A0A3N4I425_ASCIM|nr:hypothetical protein BJ508DRAFT_347308 [Ascobolus immersus RN42]